MNNFEYLLPTKVIFGRDTEQRAGELIRNYGGTKVLLHYGMSFAEKSGLVARVQHILNAEGIKTVSLGGVIPNPLLAKVREGVTLARHENVDFILALGGGSVIDSAKAIAVGLAHPGMDVWDFYSSDLPLNTAFPLGVILTIAAAGSETSKSSVISNEEGQKRPLNNEVLRPRFAVMNPELTFSLPNYQSACGVVDIMSHSLERYFSKGRGGDVTDEMIEGLLRAVIRNAEILLKNPRDYNARAEIMWAGSLAHTDILGVGRIPDWASHRIEHEMTRYTGITHGAGLAIVMPALMKYLVKSETERFARLAVKIWGVSPGSGSDTDIAFEGIQRMEAFYASLGMPVRLGDAGISSNLINDIASDVQRGENGQIGVYRNLSKDDVMNILKIADTPFG